MDLSTLFSSVDTVGWRVTAALVIFGGFIALKLIFKTMKFWVLMIIAGLAAFAFLGMIYISILNDAPTTAFDEEGQRIRRSSQGTSNRFWEKVSPFFGN